MKKFDCCVWDFNGTILDDVETGMRSVNKMLSDRGLPILNSKEDYYAHFRFPIIEYYRSLGFDFESEPYEVLAPIWVEQYLINVKNAPMCEGVCEALTRFKNEGIRQVVISATEIDMLRGQLGDLGILEFFDEIRGLDNIHAASKVELAKAWRAEHKNEKLVFIGDTTHDWETAKAIDAECYLIEGGHQSRETLESTGAKIFSNLNDACNDIIK